MALTHEGSTPKLTARWIAGGLAVAFGIATVVSGGRALFGAPTGDTVVPFVLLFNFGAGFLYLMAGVGALLGRPWAVWLARLLALTTVAVFAALGIHILSGGDYAPRTPVAMTVRSAFWVAQALVLTRVIGRPAT